MSCYAFCRQCNVCLSCYVQGDPRARGPKLLSIKSIPEFGETHLSVLGCERKPVAASIMSRPCFASFTVCVYKFSSNYFNKIIFIDNSLGPLATESPCISVHSNIHLYPPLCLHSLPARQSVFIYWAPTPAVSWFKYPYF